MTPTRMDRRRLTAIMAAIAAFEGVAPEAVRVTGLRAAADGVPGAPPAGWPSLWALAGRQAQMAARTPARTKRS